LFYCSAVGRRHRRTGGLLPLLILYSDLIKNFESNEDARRISQETTIIETMKPTFPTIDSTLRRGSFGATARGSRRQPITDYNYHFAAFESSSADGARASARSFWHITGDYFKNEARPDFLGEAALFVVIIITALLPLMNNTHALVEFVRAISSY
jgi:hypothetical protein